MGEQEQYSLSWMSFTNNMISGYQELYRDQSFTDVTLAADGVVIKCHRLVLAISSDFFKRMLESCSANNHPIIYLNNISHQNLRNLLDFMYYGEARVDNSELSQFILNAESLQIKGLAGAKTGSKQSKASKRKSSLSIANRTKSPKIQEEAEYLNEEDMEHIKNADDPENAQTEYTSLEEIEQTDLKNEIDDDPDDSNYVPEFDTTEEEFAPDKSDVGIEYDMGFPTDKDEVRFIRSQKHNAQLVYNMCIYNRKKILQNGCTTWRCCENLKYKCKSVCITCDDRFVSARHKHNHPNHWEKIANRPLHERSELEGDEILDESED